MTELVCWQPLLTDHQRHTLDALGRMLGTTPDYIVATRGLDARDRQGWTRVDAVVTELPAAGLWHWTRVRLARNPTAIHIFGSPFGEWRLIAVLFAALRSGARVWLVSEPWSDAADGYFAARPRSLDRIKAALRPWLYRFYGRMIRKRVAGIFAISPLAIAQYRTIGVPADRIFPFGYFVPGPAELPPPLPAASTLRVVFVGALIARKGITELIAAAEWLRSRHADVAIDVFGSGHLPPDSGLTHRGTIPFGEASGVIAAYDLLVVPSHHDGWAVVVNEALAAGVPVVASDRTGAGAMIDRWGCGARFPAGNAVALADTLAGLAADRTALAAMRTAARALAPALAPAVGGAYMAAAIGGQPQANPWY